ncbi:sigma-54 dependent transcriptional regulator [Candidatus Berkiella cookevillensis]|uniref:Sigma-54 dependent transcriptional regulator n=1 Tax=Candidatus Berkiella cookevillensis TaxID=437022 RepID=A0A0Q9YEZ2_9GAMM|nr:sigma-54 dependent transcriptional regulator [Candidatus Berkiella cookevillensis]MCS5709480.1 sigma-54 dependent transcriptional regulator [Candidatus Berkiella cookevillensis]
MNRKSILIVDDEPDICQLLGITLSKMGLETQTASTFDSAQKLLCHQQFDLCLTDMRLPDGNGLDLVRHIQNNSPHTPVAVITAHGKMETAIQAMKLGAFDFINKPVDLKILRNLIEDALNINYSSDSKSFNLIGESECILQLKTQIEKIARSQAPVYISGQSGVGKELVARLIHQNSPRREKPFIPVNCGAIPIELMESEFFGHKKGSFTGAHQDKMGFFQAAHQGTLFLDEVADLPPNMQVKLLRGIQEKSFRPVGDTKEHSADVRFLCATHKDLSKLVQTGFFREDLFYRLNVIEIKVPSLIQRINDIPLLVTYILKKIIPNDVTIPKVSVETLEALKQYSFPGNIRELENILERAYTLSDGKEILTTDLQLPLQARKMHSHDFNMSLDEHLEQVEKEAILKALDETKGNKTLAAKLLGVTFRTLRYRLKKLGIDDDSES